MRSVRSSLHSMLAASVVLALAACDGLLVDPAQPRQLPLALVLVAGGAHAGPAEAFDAADRIDVRLRQGEQLILEMTEAFASGGGDVRLPLSVSSEFDGQTLSIEVRLIAGTDPLFAGSGTITPVTGRTTAAEVMLLPIVADITISPGKVTLDAIAATAQLTATALFATGDDIPGAAIVFSALSDGVVDVSANGATVALAEGTAQIQARSGTVTSTATATVRQAVTAIDFGQAPTSIPVGGGNTFVVTLRDRNGYPVLNRTVQWTSSDPGILKIDANGVATALAPGTVTLTAMVDDFSSMLTVTVIQRVPIAPTALAATARDSTVSLTWQDASDNETSFEVWRRTVADATDT
ncbi:MAG: Ig-like domain-containing protein, partial [Longimicrobiales bacterium]